MPLTEPTQDGTPRGVFGAMLRFYRQRAELSQDALGLLERAYAANT